MCVVPSTKPHITFATGGQRIWSLRSKTELVLLRQGWASCAQVQVAPQPSVAATVDPPLSQQKRDGPMPWPEPPAAAALRVEGAKTAQPAQLRGRGGVGGGLRTTSFDVPPRYRDLSKTCILEVSSVLLRSICGNGSWLRWVWLGWCRLLRISFKWGWSSVSAQVVGSRSGFRRPRLSEAVSLRATCVQRGHALLQLWAPAQVGCRNTQEGQGCCRKTSEIVIMNPDHGPVIQCQAGSGFGAAGPGHRRAAAGAAAEQGNRCGGRGRAAAARPGGRGAGHQRRARHAGGAVSRPGTLISPRPSVTLQCRAEHIQLQGLIAARLAGCGCTQVCSYVRNPLLMCQARVKVKPYCTEPGLR